MTVIESDSSSPLAPLPLSSDSFRVGVPPRKSSRSNALTFHAPMSASLESWTGITFVSPTATFTPLVGHGPP